MDKREETPDVLGQILGGPKKPETPVEAPTKAAEGQLEAQAETPSETVEEQPVKKPAKRRQRARKPAPAPPPSDEKVKATFYLSPGTLDSLEEGKLQLRRMAGSEKRGQVSKSLIVELALQMALRELESKKGKSQLAIMLSSQ